MKISLTIETINNGYIVECGEHKAYVKKLDDLPELLEGLLKDA